MEGGRNGMELYGEVTIEKHSFDIAKKRLGDEGNTATMGKYAFAVAGEGNTASIGKGIIERFAKPMSAKPIPSQEGFASDLEWPKATFSNPSIVEIGRRNWEGNSSYAKSRSEGYDKPKRQLSDSITAAVQASAFRPKYESGPKLGIYAAVIDEGHIAPHRPVDPFR